MRVLILAALSLALLGAGPRFRSVAHAQDSVLLLETDGLRPALCAALRIQLSDLADVHCRVGAASADLALRIRVASAQVTQEQRRLAVLLERDPDPHRVRMILVGREPDRAVLAIESIEDREAPDVDRSLALKVRDIVEQLGSDNASTARSSGLARVLTPRAGTPSASSTHVLLEAGAALSSGAQTRAAGLLGMGVRAARGAGYAELVLDARMASATHTSNALGAVKEREWQPTVALRAGRVRGPISIGALGEAGVLLLQASGRTADGSHGEQTLAVARLGLGLDLRFMLWRGAVNLMLRVAPTLQVDPVAQRLALDHQRALSLGRLHAFLPLTFLLELPRPRATGAGDV